MSRLYFSNCGRREAGVVTTNLTAEVADEYGQGRDINHDPYSDNWHGSDDSTCHLYTKDGQLTKHRVLRGVRARIRRLHRGHLRFHQNEVNDRYMRMLSAKVEASGGVLPDKGLLSGLPMFGDFYHDVRRIVMDRETMYRGLEAYRYGNDLDLGDYMYCKLPDGIHLYAKNQLGAAKMGSIRTMIRMYIALTQSPIPLGSESAMKKRFGWKIFRAGGAEKYSEMVKQLKSEYFSETGDQQLQRLRQAVVTPLKPRHSNVSLHKYRH